MKMHEMPPVEVLRWHFRIDAHSRLERRMAGGGWKLAAKARGGRNYFTVGFQGKQFLAHRIIWTLHYGVPPDGLVDHINGQPWDNRIENLREATHAQNRWNTKTTGRKNRTGFDNVVEQEAGFRGRVMKNYEVHVSPVFDDPELAALAASEMAHKLHGEFAYANREAA